MPAEPERLCAACLHPAADHYDDGPPEYPRSAFQCSRCDCHPYGNVPDVEDL